MGDDSASAAVAENNVNTLAKNNSPMFFRSFQASLEVGQSLLIGKEHRFSEGFKSVWRFKRAAEQFSFARETPSRRCTLRWY